MKQDPRYEAIKTTLLSFGITLDDDQLHIGGERAVMSQHKLVLTGTKNGERVVIKVSLDVQGATDIKTEADIRGALEEVRFANGTLIFPPEDLFTELPDGTVINVTAFIEQEKVFVEHTLREQFFMALRWFEAQESFHATTHEHLKSLKGTFAVWTADTYIKDAQDIADSVTATAARFNHAPSIGQQLLQMIETNQKNIERYGGFLNHTDLVPHNFRINNGTLYALDQVSIWFGNKYEGLARFINYMLIHNPKLADMLVSYVEEYRGKDDAEMLRIMRCYKVGVLLRYYARTIANSEGDLRTLSEVRFEFWMEIFDALFMKKSIGIERIEAYKNERDTLRTDDEKKRQREFAKA
jgi:hypothetical protein